MSTLEDLDDIERQEKEDKKDQDGKDNKDNKPTNGDAEMKDAEAKKEEEEEDPIDEDVLNSSTRDIVNRRRLLENDLRIMKSEFQRLTHEKATMNEKIKDNVDKIENNKYVWNARSSIFLLRLTNAQTTTISRWQRSGNSGSGRRS